MANRASIARAFLWLAVLAGGPLLGAKLFDLVVLAGAWSAHPPASLAMMPYGRAWPIDTGVFFIPLSAAMLVAGFGALSRSQWRGAGLPSTASAWWAPPQLLSHPCAR